MTTLVSSKPIMVTYGTKRGPIIPPSPSATSLTPTSRQGNLNPAPVIERIDDDTPNPVIYKPLIPHQYRTKIYSYKPNPNLIFGTPIDQKYTPNYIKYNIYKKKEAKSLGLDYRGPHVFVKQDYEDNYYKEQQNLLRRNFNYQEPTTREINLQKTTQQGNIVPEIGIVYSSGLRYYVPQIVPDNQENSVYHPNDWKYVTTRN